MYINSVTCNEQSQSQPLYNVSPWCKASSIGHCTSFSRSENILALASHSKLHKCFVCIAHICMHTCAYSIVHKSFTQNCSHAHNVVVSFLAHWTRCNRQHCLLTCAFAIVSSKTLPHTMDQTKPFPIQWIRQQSPQAKKKASRGHPIHLGSLCYYNIIMSKAGNR